MTTEQQTHFLPVHVMQCCFGTFFIDIFFLLLFLIIILTKNTAALKLNVLFLTMKWIPE